VDVLSWGLRRGDCVLFHPHALHGAAPVEQAFLALDGKAIKC
jgi:hypothetical protein